MDTGEITVGEEETLRISKLLEEGEKSITSFLGIVMMRIIRHIRLARMGRGRGKGKKEMGMGMHEVEVISFRMR